MDIHKPKAAHSWREFLIEIGTITCGILIALGLEQVVEWAHWRHLSEQQARELESGAAWNMALSAQRLAIVDCQTAALKEIGTRLRAPGERWTGLNPKTDERPSQYLQEIIRFPSHPWAQAAWQSAVANGTLAHLPSRTVRLYAFLDSAARHAEQLDGEKQALKDALTPLAFDQMLNTADKAHYLATVARLDDLERDQASTTAALFKFAGYWGGVRPDRDDLRKLLSIEKNFPASCFHPVDVEALARTNPGFVPR